MVIYEVYPVTFAIDGIESSLQLISNDRNDFSSLKMVISNNNINTYNTFAYSFFVDVFNLNKNYSEPTIIEDDSYVTGGFVEKKMTYNIALPLEKTDISINKKQLEVFFKILSKLKNKNIKVILVYAPITKSSYLSYTNNSYFDSLMHSCSEYYNFNEMMNLNDSLHFYDSHHLNQNGVKLFNNKFIRILKEK